MSLREDLPARLLAVIAGGTLLQFAFRLRVRDLAVGDWWTIGVVLALYGAALGCFVIAILDVDLSRWVPRLVGMTFAGLAGTIALWYAANADARLGADAILHVQYATDLVLGGVNPYTQDMTAAYDHYPIDPDAVTRLEDGSVIEQYIYPGASVVPFIPQRALGLPNANLTAMVAFLAVAWVVVQELPEQLQLGGVAALLASPDLFWWSTGGIWDMVWVLPLLLSMHYWAAERYRPAAITLGVAGAIKPQPWFIAPFLAIWLLRAHPWPTARRHLRTCLGWGGGVFLAFNLPYIVDAPAAWLVAMLRPLGVGGPDVVPLGVGLILVYTHGGVAIPLATFTVLFIAVFAALLGLYYRYFKVLKWLAWIAPALVLFVSHRSTHNYFLAFIPIAAYAAALVAQQRCQSGPATPEVVS